MYQKKYKPEFIKDLKNIRDKKTKKNIKNTIESITETVMLNPKHYKNLKYPLNKYKCVHVNKSFVILFQIKSKEKIIEFCRYQHHDKIYK